MNSSSIKIHALLDFGTSACFINNHHKLSLVTKKHPIPVEVIDGGPLVLGNVTHETTLLDIILKDHHNIIAFIVINSLSNSIDLGLFWLNKYNPTID
jgi:hypothetical protein